MAENIKLFASHNKVKYFHYFSFSLTHISRWGISCEVSECFSGHILCHFSCEPRFAFAKYGCVACLMFSISYLAANVNAWCFENVFFSFFLFLLHFVYFFNGRFASHIAKLSHAQKKRKKKFKWRLR